MSMNDELENGLYESRLDSDCLDELRQLIKHIAGNALPDYKVALALRSGINRYLEVTAKLPREYDFGGYLEAFMTCCQNLGIGQSSFSVTDQTVDQLINEVRRYCRTDVFRETVRIERREADTRLKEYIQYIDGLFDMNDRIIVLRLDLGYRKAHSGSVTLDIALEDMNRLLRNRRANQLFNGNIGYVIKTEFGIDRRIHFHTLFFFNGSHRQGNAHVRLAQQIGEYWCKTITKGWGDYWSCNRQVKDFEQKGRCGIGLIRWSDTNLRQNLQKYVLAYLCKADQAFRSRHRMKSRMMRRGALPQIRSVKLGRPRICL